MELNFVCNNQQVLFGHEGSHFGVVRLIASITSFIARFSITTSSQCIRVSSSATDGGFNTFLTADDTTDDTFIWLKSSTSFQNRTICVYSLYHLGNCIKMSTIKPVFSPVVLEITCRIFINKTYSFNCRMKHSIVT